MTGKFIFEFEKDLLDFLPSSCGECGHQTQKIMASIIYWDL